MTAEHQRQSPRLAKKQAGSPRGTETPSSSAAHSPYLTSAAKMLESDPDTLDSGSSGSYDESDSIEIITDSMRVSNLGHPEAKPVASKSVNKDREYAKPSSIKAKMANNVGRTWESDRDFHNTLFTINSPNANDRAQNAHLEEIRTTPLFSASVLASVINRENISPGQFILPQYGLLAQVQDAFDAKEPEVDDLLGLVDAFGDPIVAKSKKPVMKAEDNRLFVNMNAPWSAFICGSQGSGKSHTLSCMLEAALIPSRLGKLPRPLSSMVFHYDKFTGFSSSQICEAAYLASSGIPVRVLVSPSNLYRMTKAYQNLPGFPQNAKRPVVAPLLLQEKHLNVERMMKLMAVDERDGKVALYMESVCKILRSLAMKNQDAAGLNYREFKQRVSLETFNDAQKAMLNTRLDLLESFMFKENLPGAERISQTKPQFADSRKGREKERIWQTDQDDRRRAAIGKANIWSFEPGTLTIVDLSCPFVDESAACALFNICLALFLEERQHSGRIVALDEAHKFMTGTQSSSTFTESLLSVIRQQRHLATRVIIATQEPTISPSLLDLSSMTIVHRFTSPNWLAALKSHLAGVSSDGATKQDVSEIFKKIVNLEAGQALLFSPSAMLGADAQANDTTLKMSKLGIEYVKVRVRKRMTADGGRSILAT